MSDSATNNKNMKFLELKVVVPSSSEKAESPNVLEVSAHAIQSQVIQNLMFRHASYKAALTIIHKLGSQAW